MKETSMKVNFIFHVKKKFNKIEKIVKNFSQDKTNIKWKCTRVNPKEKVKKRKIKTLD